MDEYLRLERKQLFGRFEIQSVPVTSSSDPDFLLNQILPVFVPAYSQYYR